MKTAPMLRPRQRSLARPFKSSLRDSLYALLTGTPAAQVSEEQVDAIRAQMLHELEADTALHVRAIRHIRFAPDVQSLWFLRGELMAALSGQCGESEARARLDRISRMFDGLLPRSLKSRPSPLES